MRAPRWTWWPPVRDDLEALAQRLAMVADAYLVEEGYRLNTRQRETLAERFQAVLEDGGEHEASKAARG